MNRSRYTPAESVVTSYVRSNPSLAMATTRGVAPSGVPAALVSARPLMRMSSSPSERVGAMLSMVPVAAIAADLGPFLGRWDAASTDCSQPQGDGVFVVSLPAASGLRTNSSTR